MINPAKLLQMKSAWDRFNNNHPKFQPFIRAVGENGVAEGCVFEITMTTPDGKTMKTNVKLKEDDIELFHTLKDLMG